MSEPGILGFAVKATALAGATALLVGGVALTSTTRQASATPAFTQQTKQPCTKCHSAPPALNDFGKAFKANGNKLPEEKK